MSNGLDGLFGQLQSICRHHPLDRKIILTPKQESGRSLIEGLVRQGTSVVGLGAATVQRLARLQAALSTSKSEETVMAGGAGSLMVTQILNEESGETVERRAANATHRLLQIQELRHRNWKSDDGKLGRIFDQYEAELQSQGLLDGPALLQRAKKALEKTSAPEIEEAVLILLPALTAHSDESEYIDALCENASQVYQLGKPVETDWSETPNPLYRLESSEHAVGEELRFGVGAEALRGTPPAEQSVAEQSVDVSPIRASTPEVEIATTLREIKARGLSLDEVEVAYVSPDPYLDLWIREARRLQRQFGSERLPVTFGGGLPPRQTRAGRSLLAYFQLAEEGLESPRLVRMLRNNTLRPPKETVVADRAADILAKIRPEPTQEGYLEALEAHEKDSYSSLKNDQLESWKAFIDALFETVPEEDVSVEALASKAEKYLRKLGGVSDLAAASHDSTASGLEVAEYELAAYDELTTNLKRIGDTTGDLEEQAPVLARLLETITSERYVGAETPRPGAVHLTPVQHAGYSGREVLVVMGLDANSVSEDLFSRPILPEGIEEEKTTATQAWAVEAALSRHTGDVIALSPQKQLDTGRILQPSFLFGQLVEVFGEENENGEAEAQSEGFAASDPTQATSQADYWQAVVDRAPRYNPEAIRNAIEEEYPHILNGRNALLARIEEQPEYAGRLNPEKKPTLDFSSIAIRSGRDDPLSASQLQRLAKSPYGFFFERVIGIDTPEEPALDEEEWLDHLQYGTLVHDVLEEFMKDLGRKVHTGDWEELWSAAERKITEMKTRLRPPGPGLEARRRNQLRRDLQAFFRQELQREPHLPWDFEWKFGYDDHNFDLELPGGLTFPFRGKIDRIDELGSGGYALWDYKTGKSDDFDPSNPLGNGETLQWDLYARAFEAVEGERVETSGYYFTSDREQGYLLDFRGASSQESLNEEWEDLAATFRKVGEGEFGQDFKGNVWSYDLNRLEELLTAGEHLTPRSSS